MIQRFDPLPLLAPLERAAGALGRLAHTAAVSPVLAAWLHRARTDAAVAIADAQGRRVDPFRLRAMLAQVPTRPDRDWGSTRLALEALRRLLDHADPAARASDRPPDEADAALGHMEAALAPHGGAVLLACGAGFLQHLEAGGDRLGACLAVPGFLAGRGLTPLPLPCLNGVEAIRRAESSRPWLDAWLDGLAVQAEAGEESLVALLHRWRGWRRRVGDRRRDARIRRAVDLVAAEGVVSPARLAARLRCATSVATDLLEELQRLGVVVEITRRRTHRAFAAEDLDRMLDQIARPPAAVSPPAAPAPAEPEAWLDHAEDVDDAMANLKRVMDRLDPLLVR